MKLSAASLYSKTVNLVNTASPIVMALLIVVVGLLFYELVRIKETNSEIRAKQIEQEDSRNTFVQKHIENLYDDHLAVTQLANIEQDYLVLTTELEALKAAEATDISTDINNFYEDFESFKTKLARNNTVKLNSEDVTKISENWGTLLLEKNITKLNEEVKQALTDLDTSYTAYVATLPPPPKSNSSYYSYTNVNTSKGAFGTHLIKAELSKIKVKTLTANTDTCKDNCPTKNLAQYVSENNGFAGINGTYFCPPDYPACSGKINSYDYAVYNSNSEKWLSKNSLDWNKTGLATFSGSSAKFYKDSTEYGGGNVSAGIVNYPPLLQGNSIVVKESDLTTFQKDVKGTRGAIGSDGKYIYLALINGATVIDAAYVMQALGATSALNLDGGGSSALYIEGSYVVGPGRGLPNAIVLTF